ncbi:hypothetical protein H9P43_001738 [Blastocladiella emersonii ATCC 22665]|nr:hypothetical protein H9P43_001738 [Blastocladiella emersonii ATCC 22665]
MAPNAKSGSNLRNRGANGASAASAKPTVVDDISEADKLRFIKESGLMEKIASSDDPRFKDLSRSTATPGLFAAPTTHAQAFTASLFFVLPLAALYVWFEGLVHQQYGEDVPFATVATGKLPTVVPALLAVVFLVHRWVNTNVVQYGMAMASVGLGARMLYLVLGQHTYGAMLAVPGLAVVWIYCVAQMRLPLALGSLALVFAYTLAYLVGTAEPATEYPDVNMLF